MGEIHPFYQAHRGAMEAAMRQRLDLAETMLRERAHLADLDKVRQDVMDEFEIVLSQMPYVGGAASRMSDFFMRLMGFMAIGRVLRRHGVALPDNRRYRARELQGSIADRCRRPNGSHRDVSSCLAENQVLAARAGGKKPGERISGRFRLRFRRARARTTALNSASTTRLAASANSPRVTAIKEILPHICGLDFEAYADARHYVWNEPRRWLAAPATAIFASPASKQSRTCPAFASGQSRRFDVRPATSGLPRATDIVGAGRQVRFVPQADLALNVRCLPKRRR